MSLGIHPIHNISHDEIRKVCECLNIVVTLAYVAKRVYLDVVSKGVHVSYHIALKMFYFTYALHLNSIMPMSKDDEAQRVECMARTQFP
mgnify:CR=1